VHSILPFAFLGLSAWLSACSSDSDADGPPDNTGSVGGGGGVSGNGGWGATGGCSTEAEHSTALSLDGIDDRVSLGVASELGLGTFTVEAWVRRTAKGLAASTGVGGISVVPIAGKGRGESDGTNVDCNYAFGFVGDVLGADFEDMASGDNHPVVGSIGVPLYEWHHVAVTYDGDTWQLFVDGVLDVEKAVNAEPRSDSIQHFGIGALFDSTGASAGHFAGEIDELRVWDHARTGDEIWDNRYASLASGTGLLARFAFENDLTNDVGSLDGTPAGDPTYLTDGPVFDAGIPPVASPTAPAQDSVVTGTTTTLSITVSDADPDQELGVTFYARQVSTADDFTIAVLPDTQYYTVESKGFEDYFYDQTEWIMKNREAYDIRAVIHNGDVVDHGDTYGYEWTVADGALSALEVPSEALPEGLPWGPCVGNHDQTPNGTPGNTKSFNKWFGVERFAQRSYYGGHYGSANDESWITFTAGGLDFVVVNLQYDTSPDPAVLTWARSIFQAHPNAFGILNTHYILSSAGAFGTQGKAIYEALKGVDNVQLMTCGHVSAESKRTDEFEGNVIHSMLADYQGRANGGSGWMRIWEFSPASNELTVRSYSPTLDKWETDANSEFTLSVDLAGAANGSFQAIAVSARAEGTHATVDMNVAPGKTYEWYATITDCSHSVDTPVQRFTTN
jgi:hypothetical protein